MPPDNLHPHDDGPSLDDADRRITEALTGVPSPEMRADLASRVLARISRRRLQFRAAALAAAVAVPLLGWSLWRGRPGHTPEVAIENAGQEALVAQWDELLDEAAALPPVVVDLSILETQRAWMSALQEVQRR